MSFITEYLLYPCVLQKRSYVLLKHYVLQDRLYMMESEQELNLSRAEYAEEFRDDFFGAFGTALVIFISMVQKNLPF